MQQELTAMTEALYNARVLKRDLTFRDVVPTRYVHQKRYLCPLLAVLLLVPAAPMIVVLMAIVRLTSRGPALFRQQRVGRFGRCFTMYKLRTMYEDAEERTGPVWSQRDDPRTTPIGQIMRTLHLDELPQLINVIRGEMSLVGPRPERPEFVEMLADEIPGYLDRLSVLPGITGLAQIHLPPDVNVDCVRRKLILDLHYIETATAWVDLRVILCSFVRMIGLPGLVAARLLGFRYPYALLRPLGPARDSHDGATGSPLNGHARPVALCDLKTLLSGGAHRVAAASPHLFTFQDEDSPLETVESKVR